MYPEKKDIEVRLLNADLENFRIGEQDNARSAYHAIIEQEGKDLVELADDIVTMGLSLADTFIVCPDPAEPGHYVVCDGNRRFTSLKLLETPALAAGTPVHKDFLELSKLYAKNRIKKVSTVVYADKAAAMPWIRRRHLDLKGRGQSKWGGAATSRADAYVGDVRAHRAVLDHLKAHDQLPPTLERSVTGRTTNLDRVLQMPYMASALGVTISKDGSVAFGSGDLGKGNDLLLRMVKAMAAPKFNVNSIRRKDEREEFIDTFAKHAVLAAGTAAGGSTKAATAKAAAAGGKMTRKSPSQDDRKTLALRGRENILTVKEPRLNELYDEATKIEPLRLPNGAAILTRVFLELSTDHFLAKKKIPLPPKHVNSGKKNWRDKGITLGDKLAVVMNTLDPNKSDEFKFVRVALSDQDALHSVQSLHDFLHKLSADPDPKEIKRIWKRWHPYLQRLYEELL